MHVDAPVHSWKRFAGPGQTACFQIISHAAQMGGSVAPVLSHIIKIQNLQSCFTLSRDGSEGNPGVGASVSSSRALFSPPFASTGVEDVGVEVAVCAGVGISPPLAFIEAL